MSHIYWTLAYVWRCAKGLNKSSTANFSLERITKVFVDDIQGYQVSDDHTGPNKIHQNMTGAPTLVSDQGHTHCKWCFISFFLSRCLGRNGGGLYSGTESHAHIRSKSGTSTLLTCWLCTRIHLTQVFVILCIRCFSQTNHSLYTLWSSNLGKTCPHVVESMIYLSCEKECIATALWVCNARRFTLFKYVR